MSNAYFAPPRLLYISDGVRISNRISVIFSATDIDIITGSPIIMVDKADPSYVIPSGRTPIPATGEALSITTIAGIIMILGVCVMGIILYKKET